MIRPFLRICLVIFAGFLGYVLIIWTASRGSWFQGVSLYWVQVTIWAEDSFSKSVAMEFQILLVLLQECYINNISWNSSRHGRGKIFLSRYARISFNFYASENTLEREVFLSVVLQQTGKTVIKYKYFTSHCVNAYQCYTMITRFDMNTIGLHDSWAFSLSIMMLFANAF